MQSNQNRKKNERKKTGNEKKDISTKYSRKKKEIKEKMRVLVIHEGVHSVDYHRLIVPFADIDRNFDDINLFSLNSLEGVTADDLKREQIDIVVFSRNISAKLLAHR